MNRGHFWIGMVLLLLAGNMVAVGTLIVKAGDPTSRVLPDYYQRAASYDDTMAAQRASLALGWGASAEVHDGVVEVRMRDGGAAPLAGAAVTVAVDPLNRADRTATAALAETAPGVYTGTIGDGPLGLYTVAVTADRGGDHYISTSTVERR